MSCRLLPGDSLPLGRLPALGARAQFAAEPGRLRNRGGLEDPGLRLPGERG